MAADFSTRVRNLPTLGLGISTEFGAGAGGLDPLALRALRPDYVGFLEIGADLERGFDPAAEAWIASGAPTTYHFLDLNLEEPTSLDTASMRETAVRARRAGAAWLCGDAGLWHIGRRDRGHGILQPPILEPSSVDAMADSVRRLRDATGFEVLPENPPAHVYLGRMHLLDYFAALAERADTGLLVDLAHLAVYQRVMGHKPLEGFDRFPWDRVVEIHIAGGTPFRHAGRTFIDDDHGTTLLPELRDMMAAAFGAASNLRAVVCECERHPIPAVLPLFASVKAAFDASAAVRGSSSETPSRAAPMAPTSIEGDMLAPLQRTLFRCQMDPAFARRWRGGDAEARRGDGLSPSARDLLVAASTEGVGADNGGRRSAQVLGNVSLECSATVALAMDGGRDSGFVAEFVASPEFHGAVMADAALPPAFAAYATARTSGSDDAFLRAVAHLERALVEVRRMPDGTPPPAGTFGVSPAVAVVSVPEGTLDGWLAVLDALRAGKLSKLPRAASGPEDEYILLSKGGSSGAFAPPPGAAELLDPGTAALLRAAAIHPLSEEDIAALARDHEADPADVRGLVDSLVADGVLVYGGTP